MTTIRALTLTVSLIGLTFHSVGGYADVEQVLEELSDALSYTKFTEDVYEDQSNINGWENIGDFSHPSGFYYRAYQKGNEIVVAFRGTELTSLADLTSNALSYFAADIQGLLAGALAEEFLPTIPTEGDFKITFVGHSLGGGLAQIATVVANEEFPNIQAKGYTYNTKGVVGDVLDKLEEFYDDYDKADITNICADGDLVCLDLGRKNNLGETIEIPGFPTHKISGLIKQIEAVIDLPPEAFSLINDGDKTTIALNSGREGLVVRGALGAAAMALMARTTAAETNGGNSNFGSASMYFGDSYGRTQEDENLDEDRLNNQRPRGHRAENLHFDGRILTGDVEITSFYGGNAENFFSHFTGQGNVDPFGTNFIDREATTLIRGTDGLERFHTYQTPANGRSAPTINEILSIPNAGEFGDEGLYQMYIYDYGNRDRQGSDYLTNSGMSVTIREDGEVREIFNIPKGRGNTWQAVEFDTIIGTIDTTTNFKDIEEPEDVPFNDPAVNSPIIDRDTLTGTGGITSGDGL